MSFFPSAATEPEGRRASQTGLLEGGAISVPPKIALLRPLPTGRRTAMRLTASCSRSPRRPMINPSRHPFSCLTSGVHSIYPDVEADRRLYEALRRGDYETWRRTSLAALEDAGQHEVLNWYCLVGAMAALGRKPDECDYAETWAFVAGKCIAVWRP